MLYHVLRWWSLLRTIIIVVVTVIIHIARWGTLHLLRQRLLLMLVWLWGMMRVVIGVPVWRRATEIVIVHRSGLRRRYVVIGDLVRRLLVRRELLMLLWWHWSRTITGTSVLLLMRWKMLLLRWWRSTAIGWCLIDSWDVLYTWASGHRTGTTGTWRRSTRTAV